MTDGNQPTDGGAEPDPAGAREVRRGWPTFELNCVVEDREDHPDRCVVYPRDADEVEVSSRWLAATEGSFFDLETVR